MTEREKLAACLQSFYRNRHGSRPLYKNSKRRQRQNDAVPVFRRYRQLVHKYIQDIRALDRAESARDAGSQLAPVLRPLPVFDNWVREINKAIAESMAVPITFMQGRRKRP